MDASPLLDDSCSGFWAPLQLLVSHNFIIPAKFTDTGFCRVMPSAWNIFAFLTRLLCSCEIAGFFCVLFRVANGMKG